MKELIKKYKSVMLFILTFLLVYIFLTLLYKFYLDYSENLRYYPDYITNLVALQCEQILNTVGYKSTILPHPDEPSVKLIIRDKYLARVIEGCNSISVIILFISFVIAFSGKLKTTLLFLLIGSTTIYIANLFRIVVLSIGLFHYPSQSNFLHTVIFPAIIYGIVFLLWILWVNRYTNISKKNESTL